MTHRVAIPCWHTDLVTWVCHPDCLHLPGHVLWACHGELMCCGHEQESGISVYTYTGIAGHFYGETCSFSVPAICMFSVFVDSWPLSELAPSWYFQSFKGTLPMNVPRDKLRVVLRLKAGT